MSLIDLYHRLRDFLPRSPAASRDIDVVSRWASARFLGFRRLAAHQFELHGLLHDRSWRVECKPSAKPYITGLELRARIDLALPPGGHVVLLSRTLLQQLESQASALYDHAVADLQTQAKAMPEELRLLQYREVRWLGAPESFWQRYAVLSDAPGLARRWLDAEAQGILLVGDSPAAAQVPLLVMLTRGKCYLRLQVNPHARDSDSLLALDLLEQLSGRALALAARATVSDEDGLSSPV